MTATGDRKTYTVFAKPWEHGWELRVAGVGVTQSYTLDDAEMMARDLIASYEDVPAGSFDVVITSETEPDGPETASIHASLDAGLLPGSHDWLLGSPDDDQEPLS